MSRARALGDTRAAAVLAAASAFLLVHEWRNPSGTPIFGVSTSTVPTATAGLIMALSVALLVRSIVVSRWVEVSPQEAHSDGSQPPTWRPYAFGALCVAYVVIMPWLGYVAASGLFVGALAWLFGNRRPLVIVALMAAAPLALSLFFEKAMVVYLPASRLFQ